MPSFKNLQDLENHLNKSVQGGGTKFPDGKSLKQVMIDEAKRLEKLLRQEISDYLNSYDPVKYVRTGNWMDSIQRDTHAVMDADGNLSITIGFDKVSYGRQIAYHESYIGISPDEQPFGYVPWLMEVGWDIRGKMLYRAYRFTDFEGTNYIKKAVTKFNATNRYGLKVEVWHGDERYI